LVGLVVEEPAQPEEYVLEVHVVHELVGGSTAPTASG